MAHNRLVQTNGRLLQKSDFRSEFEQAKKLTTTNDELKKLLGDKPGTLLLIGFVAGGILGWLTSKRGQ